MHTIICVTHAKFCNSQAILLDKSLMIAKLYVHSYQVMPAVLYSNCCNLICTHNLLYKEAMLSILSAVFLACTLLRGSSQIDTRFGRTAK